MRWEWATRNREYARCGRLLPLGRADLDVKARMVGESPFQPCAEMFRVLGACDLLLNLGRFHQEPRPGPFCQNMTHHEIDCAAENGQHNCEDGPIPEGQPPADAQDAHEPSLSAVAHAA